MANARAHAEDVRITEAVTEIVSLYRAALVRETQAHLFAELYMVGMVVLLSWDWLVVSPWTDRIVFSLALLAIVGNSALRLWRLRRV